MAKYKLTNKAVEDLDEIWEFTFDRWSEKQADDYYDILIASCEKLAKNTDLGRNYNGISKNLFGLRTNRHIIFYRIISENSVEVDRILYERMDLENRILD